MADVGCDLLQKLVNEGERQRGGVRRGLNKQQTTLMSHGEADPLLKSNGSVWATLWKERGKVCG